MEVFCMGGGVGGMVGFGCMVCCFTVLRVEGGDICFIWVKKWGQPRKLAVCGPPQLQQVGVCSGVLGQAVAVWVPAHLTHRGG